MIAGGIEPSTRRPWVLRRPLETAVQLLRVRLLRPCHGCRVARGFTNVDDYARSRAHCDMVTEPDQHAPIPPSCPGPLD